MKKTYEIPNFGDGATLTFSLVFDAWRKQKVLGINTSRDQASTLRVDLLDPDGKIIHTPINEGAATGSFAYWYATPIEIDNRFRWLVTLGVAQTGAAYFRVWVDEQ